MEAIKKIRYLQSAIEELRQKVHEAEVCDMDARLPIG